MSESDNRKKNQTLFYSGYIYGGLLSGSSDNSKNEEKKISNPINLPDSRNEQHNNKKKGSISDRTYEKRKKKIRKQKKSKRKVNTDRPHLRKKDKKISLTNMKQKKKPSSEEYVNSFDPEITCPKCNRNDHSYRFGFWEERNEWIYACDYGDRRNFCGYIWIEKSYETICDRCHKCIIIERRKGNFGFWCKNCDKYKNDTKHITIITHLILKKNGAQVKCIETEKKLVMYKNLYDSKDDKNNKELIS